MTKLEKIRDIIAKAPFAVCTTINGDSDPESRALLNLANKKQYPRLSSLAKKTFDGQRLFFTTNTSSSKVAQIRSHKRVSLYFCLPKEFRGVWISGDMEFITNPEVKKQFWTEGWEMYYPKGWSDEDYTLLALKMKKGRAYESFSVLEFTEDELSGKTGTGEKK